MLFHLGDGENKISIANDELYGQMCNDVRLYA